MTTKVKFIKKASIVAATAVMSCSLVLSQLLPIRNASAVGSMNTAQSNSAIRKVDGVDTKLSSYFNSSVVQKLPDTVKDNDYISLILKLNDATTLADAYNASNKKAGSVGAYALTSAGKAVSANISRENTALRKLLDNAGVKYELGASYDTVLGGFEIVIQAKYFNTVESLVSGKATCIVSEEYEACETQVVNNDVNVYDTGIFDSSDSDYDGSGTVIAVLDTGLDYTHSAFSLDRWAPSAVAWDQSYVQSVINGGELSASSTTAGLTSSDVYISEKIPYAYDYADQDPDVFPIQSEHGTHVAGIILGNDDTITGVAPNAQLVMMKVFSDESTGAKTSWLLAALNDCVKLGVDVINMSLGSACGFSREVDEVEVAAIYDAIGEQGISLVVAASNSYNSTFGSEKNGNLGLTSNPDSATVGSPSTYESSLSVASVSGVKTYYLKYDDTIIYFTESTNKAAEAKEFVNEIMPAGVTEKDFEYVTIPGIGLSADYSGIDVKGKIALVKRGTSSFEDKARVALEKGAAGLIVYNNVSGDISMTVGNVFNSDGTPFAVCSISQDDGEILAAHDTGVIKISKNQAAGPFMSNFSSWGPTPDLRIKPEITAHGGEILSAVPGQAYDRLSGTSMAAPNQAGFTALVRQYVMENFSSITNNDPVAITSFVNQLMMSTTDIAYNTNGLPYSVRKQGSGLANLTKATTTPAYLTTYDLDGNLMDKAKLELGDDPSKTGVYTMTFDINNVKGTSLTYDIDAIVMTEGVSDTLTYKGDRTVTEKGYLLSPTVSVISVENGTANGNSVTVSGNKSATVTVRITLSAEDKTYLNTYFANGMYVEGFVTLKAAGGTTVNLNVPYLAFYGDWTQAPIFDLDYFETNADELDNSIDTQDKTLPDAIATMPVGGLYNDYIAYLGSYLYIQDPTATQIAATRDHIALTNQTGESGGVNSIKAIWAGMLRGAKEVVMTVTDSSTGEVVFTKTVYNQRKAYNYGAAIIYSNIDVDFNIADYDLPNNGQYTFKMVAYVDYADGGLTTNVRNTFEFPFVVDYEAPIVTDVNYYTEYDRTDKVTRLYAQVAIYDNHYAQAASIGAIYSVQDEDSPYYDPESAYTYTMDSFKRYLTPIASEFNSTSYLTIELTDYMSKIKQSYNKNSFILNVIDYAGNQGVYELTIPDLINSITFEDDRFVTADDGAQSIELYLNETYALEPTLNLSGLALDATLSENWKETLTYESSDDAIVGIVNGKLIARGKGTALVTAFNTSKEEVGSFTVTVDDSRSYDRPIADSFKLTQYTVNKVFYFSSSEDRGLAATEAGTTVKFSGTSSSYSLSMYPSESFTIEYQLLAYFPDLTEVRFESNNDSIVTVDETGTVTALAEGTTSVSAIVYMNDARTYYSANIIIEVKDPYTTSGPYLMHYMGLGGEVIIPDDLSITEIYQYAFTNYHYVEKDENDVIDKENPYYTKPVPIGDDTITKVVIPEGVETIQLYAFAELTALEEVVFPSTLKKIDYYAFSGCTNLKKITFSGANNLQFINNYAFFGCAIESIELDSVVAIGTYAFYGNALKELELPETAQSIGSYAFQNNTDLWVLYINAEKIKLGDGVFQGCNLFKATVNASVIPANVFNGNANMESVTIGKDVQEISYNAFAGTAVSKFTVASGNEYFTASADGSYLTDKDKTTLLLVSPKTTTFNASTNGLGSVKTIGRGAFSGGNIRTVNMPNVTKVDDYAFYGCTSLTSVTLGTLTEVGVYAFARTSITSLPRLATGVTLGDSAFFNSKLTSVSIPDDAVVGGSAFFACANLATVTVGNNVVLGIGAFASATYSDFTGNLVAGTGADDSWEETIGLSVYRFRVYRDPYQTSLRNITIGNNVTVGANAFEGAIASSVSLGAGASIGNYAFWGCSNLTAIDLSQAVAIGNYAFSGLQSYYVMYQQYLLGSIPVGDLTLLGSGTEAIAARLTSVDLSSCKELGAYAFYCVFTLESVKLSEDITEISAGAFRETAVTSVEGLDRVTTIGVGAFAVTSLTEANVPNATLIGANAFYGCTELTSVTVAEEAIIGAAAFFNCTALETVENLDSATHIFAHAFANTALTTADLSGAYFIGDYAFEDSEITTVILGNNLYKDSYYELLADGYSDQDALSYSKYSGLGENPFAGCAISAFSVWEGDAVVPVTNYTFNETVCIINNALYQVAENGGLVLVSYPMLAKTGVFTVKDGTIRIGAKAFAGNRYLTSVELPYSLVTVGDQAFNDCGRLAVVIFRSLNAPILEEMFDEDYADDYSTNNVGLNGSGNGLGIVPFTIWNVDVTQVLYGANFAGRIGQTDQTMIVVRPSNGTSYDTFIYNLYFDAAVESGAALTEAAFDFIALVEKLPATSALTLADEAAVIAAREAYDALSAEVQAAVAEYFETLEAAEARIIILKRANATEEPPVKEDDEKDSAKDVAIIVLAVFMSVFILTTVAGATLLALVATNKISFTKKAKNVSAIEDKKAVAEEKEAAAASDTEKTNPDATEEDNKE